MRKIFYKLEFIVFIFILTLTLLSVSASAVDVEIGIEMEENEKEGRVVQSLESLQIVSLCDTNDNYSGPNKAIIEQVGDNNDAIIQQTGKKNNFAKILQNNKNSDTKEGNYAEIIQNNENNYAEIIQVGEGHWAEIKQYGNNSETKNVNSKINKIAQFGYNNSASTSIFGPHKSVTIVQVGTNQDLSTDTLLGY